MSPPFGISRRNAASQGGLSRIRSKVSAVSSVGSGGASGSGRCRMAQAESRNASRSQQRRILPVAFRYTANELDRTGIAFPREVFVQRRRERRLGPGDELQQRHGGAELPVVRSPEDLPGREAVQVVDRFRALRQTRAQHRVAKVRAGLVETPDRIAAGRLAHAEAVELGEDEPHPVGYLPPGAQFPKSFFVDVLLRLQKSIEVVPVPLSPILRGGPSEPDSLENALRERAAPGRELTYRGAHVGGELTAGVRGIPDLAKLGQRSPVVVEERGAQHLSGACSADSGRLAEPQDAFRERARRGHGEERGGLEYRSSLPAGLRLELAPQIADRVGGWEIAGHQAARVLLERPPLLPERRHVQRRRVDRRGEAARRPLEAVQDLVDGRELRRLLEEASRLEGRRDLRDQVPAESGEVG